MTHIDSIILGFLEGLTEFLPVSSTGHLILASHLLGIPQTEFVKSFEIAIQLGSILAVLVVFWKSFLDLDVLKRLIVAFIPTGIIGFLLYRTIKDVLIGDPVIVVAALIMGGLILIAVEHFHAKPEHSSEKHVRDITFRQAFLVGAAQAIAVIPGISRSGATVVGGLLMGIPRTTILTFSFLLAVPTMVMATGYDIYKNPGIFSGLQFDLVLTGFVVAFITALFVIRFALAFIRTRTFTPFGIYRIALGLIFILFIL